MDPIEPLDSNSQTDLSTPERRLRRSHVGTMRSIKAAHAEGRRPFERLGDWISRYAGSAGSIVFHFLWFTVWIVINVGLTPMEPFDPYPFGLLTMVVSLEAIFLSIFVLMTQNRESHIAEVREELTLQVILRMEAEVTKTLQLVAGLFTRMGHTVGEDPELREMLQPLQPQEMEKEILKQIREAMASNNNKSSTNDD
jgi:uncharacterized membrane protein